MFKKMLKSSFAKPKDSQPDFNSETSLTEYDFQLALSDMEESFKAYRRSQSKRDNMRCPKWLDASDGLFTLIAKQRELREKGKIVYSALVQANSMLFSSGKGNAPGNVLYSYDPYYASNPHELQSLASGLFSYKGNKGLSDETMQAIADILESELDRNLYSELPLEYTSGRQVIMTGVLFERLHLKNKRLNGSIMPLLALPFVHETLILPAHYWPDSFFTASEMEALNPDIVSEFG